MIQMVDAVGQITSWEADAVGNVLSETDPDGYISRFAYDALGRQVASVNGRGDETRVTYDAAGNITAMAREAQMLMATIWQASSSPTRMPWGIPSTSPMTCGATPLPMKSQGVALRPSPMTS
jgi:YD repeat-containing protein